MVLDSKSTFPQEMEGFKVTLPTYILWAKPTDYHSSAPAILFILTQLLLFLHVDTMKHSVQRRKKSKATFKLP